MHVFASARARFAALATVTVVSTASSFAMAQAGPDVAGAETLFEQGRQLMAAGNLTEACPKFAESQRLAPAAGTALNLATCYDKQGKTASAWGMYREAISLSIAAAQPVREQFARDRAAELEPKLIKLVINPASDTPGLEIRRDGTLMTRAQWGTPIPVDPGSHTLEASAPQKKKWRKVFEATQAGGTESITVPALEDAPVEVAPGPQAPVDMGPRDNGKTLRVVGFATMGVGAVLFGAGSFFALDSSSKKDELEAAARSGEPWSADRQATFDDGESAATMANVMFISGGVALATGAVLTVLGYMKKSERPEATRSSGPAFAGGALGPRGGRLSWTF